MTNLVLNKKYYILLCFILLINTIFAINQTRIDSLENKLKISDGVKKIIILKELIKLSDSTSSKYLILNLLINYTIIK